LSTLSLSLVLVPALLRDWLRVPSSLVSLLLSVGTNARKRERYCWFRFHAGRLNDQLKRFDKFEREKEEKTSVRGKPGERGRERYEWQTTSGKGRGGGGITEGVSKQRRRAVGLPTGRAGVNSRKREKKRKGTTNKTALGILREAWRTPRSARTVGERGMGEGEWEKGRKGGGKSVSKEWGDEKGNSKRTFFGTTELRKGTKE
jgi:hypothetical protein